MCVKQCFLTIRTSSNALVRGRWDLDLCFNPETIDQSSEYRAKGEARPKGGRKKKKKIKVMMSAFFDFHGVVHYEFLPPRQTVNKEYYLSVMRSLREAIRLKISQLWATTLGFCITKMHRLTLHSFFVTISSKMPRTSFRNHRIRMIWLRVTSGYSRNSNTTPGNAFRVDWRD